MRRSLAGALVPVAVWVPVLFLVLELSLRLFGPYLPGTYRTGTLIEQDDALGWRHIPGASAWTRSPEWVVRVDLGPDGRRGEAVSPPETRRSPLVAVLGDSFVEALQVDEPSSFSRRLAARVSRPVEVAAEGVGGYGTDQEVLALERRVAPLRPDVVVLAFAVTNDVWNNDGLLSARYEPTVKPYFAFENGQLVVRPPGPTSLSSRLQLMLPRSAALAVLKSGLLPGRLDAAVGREELSVLEEPEGEWSEAWRVTDGLLGRFVQSVRAMGAKPALVIIPDGCQVHADLCGTAPELTTSTVPQRRLLTTASRLGLTAVDLLPSFRERAATGQRLFFRTDSHWNAAGQDVAAGVVAPLIDAALR